MVHLARAHVLHIVRSMNTRMTHLQAVVAPHIETIATHPLFKHITTTADLRCFMEHHVFAVWDFMPLLKALQQQLTGVTTPWTPVGDPATRRLINEIVLDEESDELPNGTIVSHFEMYLEAMEVAGANTTPARTLVSLIESQTSLPMAMDKTDVPLAAQRFVQHTMSVVNHGLPHQIAAAFTMGREEAIPHMFATIVRDSNLHEVALLRDYLDRHIELDTDKHGPLIMAMIERLCGEDTQRWDEATSAAIEALQARAALWNSVGSMIGSQYQPEQEAV